MPWSTEVQESERLAALQRLHLMDTPPEPEFDELVRLAAAICEVPICLMTLLDDQRQWFKATFGVEVKETTREVAFCNHTIRQSDLLVVEDTTLDTRLAKNPRLRAGLGTGFMRACLSALWTAMRWDRCACWICNPAS